ncbi:hypothetical protein PNP85_04150 [Halobacterium salinarum]|uniref:hypothetical protein n=1 Tax=Halobacterium salinarum TaxID=2242 RepID=UPI002554A8A9|nr:hypothetical protein [Halobacterium salinarum]MDL0135626.1 hypothetical protein [Halobacterium salinarum]MDL0138699.1 hypothetical protein [Halobacterium salinarum]
MDSDFSVTTYALGGGLGLLMMGYATQTYFWHSYMQANPDIGVISTSPGFILVNAIISLLGTAIAFSGFSKGLARVFHEDATADPTTD